MKKVEYPKINNKLYRYKPITIKYEKDIFSLSNNTKNKPSFIVNLKELEYVKDEIINKRVHMSHPSLFNDPLDSTIKIIKNEIINRKYIDAEIIYILMMYDYKVENFFYLFSEGKYDINEIVDILKNNKIISNKKETQKQLIEGAKEFFIRQEMYPNNISICCFSENVKSMPLWSYYASNHTGVCLEYNFENLNVKNKDEKYIIDNMHHVIYSKNKTQNINYSPLIKSNEWQHECEWRLVGNNKTHYINIPNLSAIYFGVNCKDIVKKEIIKQIKRDEKIKLYQMMTSFDKYELQYKEIDKNY